jgi:hypothetical protein
VKRCRFRAEAMMLPLSTDSLIAQSPGCPIIITNPVVDGSDHEDDEAG